MGEGVAWFLVGMVVIQCIASWGCLCNFYTYRDRMQMLDSVRLAAYKEGADKARAILDGLNRVSYDRHLWYHMTLRNPKKLYGGGN